MAGPVEFRLYMRRFTLTDAASGIVPIREQVSPQHQICMYIGPELQYRYKMKISEGGKIEMVWSDWYPVPVVREGENEKGDVASDTGAT
jgi:hypothetical protein